MLSALLFLAAALIGAAYNGGLPYNIAATQIYETAHYDGLPYNIAATQIYETVHYDGLPYNIAVTQIFKAAHYGETAHNIELLSNSVATRSIGLTYIVGTHPETIEAAPTYGTSAIPGHVNLNHTPASQDAIEAAHERAAPVVNAPAPAIHVYANPASASDPRSALNHGAQTPYGGVAQVATVAGLLIESVHALASCVLPQTAMAYEIPDIDPVETISDTTLAHRKERMAQPLTGRKLMTQNSSVRVYAGEDGRFTIGTTDGKSLLYGFGRDGATSHTHFKLGSTIYGTYTDGEDHPPAPEIVSGPVLIDSSIVIQWNQDDVLITQTLTPVMLGTEGKIFIEYTFENTGSAAIDAGLLLFFDTMIAHNDYAPIATEYGYFSVEREFLAPIIPAFWQAYESSPFQTSDSLVGEGILVGSGAVMPDRLVYGDFWHYKAVEWDYVFAGGPYSDSSILYRWDERTIMPGGSMYVSTYYGQGAISSSGGSLMLSLASPSELLPRDCFDFSPNPFNLNVIVANTSPDSARGVLASIELPEGFSLATGTETASLSPSILAPGASGTISWSIRAEEDLSDSVYTLGVSATAPGLETFTASRNITITTGDRTPPTIDLAYPVVDNTISSDAIDACLIFSDESGIAPGSFRVRAGTGTYTLMDSGILTMSGDSLYAHIPFSLTGITDGPFSVEIFDLADIYGCSLPRTSFDFIQDSSPPVLELLSPAVRDTIYGSPYSIRCSIEEE